jgi:hypothetical protein
MKARYLLAGFLVAICGCSHMNHTDRGMVTGGLLGAGLGTVIGGMSGNPGAGAAIGAGTGALIGGVAGNEHDKAERRAEAHAAAVAAQNPPLAIQDVVRLAHNHISDDVIIQNIRATNSVYHLSTEDIIYLKQQGISDRVVNEMQTRRTVMVPRSQVIVLDPPPPPPPPVSVGFSYGWGHRCRERSVVGPVRIGDFGLRIEKSLFFQSAIRNPQSTILGCLIREIVCGSGRVRAPCRACHHHVHRSGRMCRCRGRDLVRRIDRERRRIHTAERHARNVRKVEPQD